MEFFENETEEGKTLHLRVGDRQKNEFEISGDFILPDSLADIKRILSISGELHPDEGRVESGKAVTSGEALFRLLFVTDGGAVRSAVFSTAYENRQALTAPEGDPTAIFLPRLTSVAARAVNPRKVGIRAKVNTGTAGWEERDASPVFPDSVTDADRMGFEELREEIPSTVLHSYFVSGVESGDDIALPEGKPAIREILSAGLTFSSLRSEAREGAVQINADADLTVIYLAQGEGEVVVFLHHKIPLSYLAEAPGTQEGDFVLATLTPGKVVATAAEGLDGTARLIEADFTYGISLVSGREEKCQVVRDLYSTDYETETVPVTLTVTKPLGRVGLREKLRGEGKFKEEAVVLGVLPQVRLNGFSKNEAGNAGAVGDVLLSVILKEADGSVVSEPVTLPFALDTGLAMPEGAEFIGTAEIAEVTARLSDGVIEASAQLAVSALGLENLTEEAVGGVKITSDVANDTPASFTVYYPAKNETVWDIAKKFRVRRDALLMSREGEPEAGAVRRALIIPKRQKAIYHGIIDA